MDSADRKILAAIQRDARLSIAALSEIAGLSTASVQRRLKSLRETGVIRGDVALLDPEKLGFGITAVVFVELARDRADQIDTFRRKARAEPHVLHLYCIAGDADFVMVVIARDMADYEAFTYRFFFSDTSVQRFRTSIAISTDKSTLEYPVPM